MTRASFSTAGRTQGFSPRLVDSAPGEHLQLLREGFEFNKTDAYSRLELDHDLHVAFRPHLPSDRGRSCRTHPPLRRTGSTGLASCRFRRSSWYAYHARLY